MKIYQLNENVFFDFASRKLGVNVRVFKNDMRFDLSEKGANLKFYIGGESLDLRKFIFTDDSCLYFQGTYNESVDLSRDWIIYLSEEVCSSENDAKYFADKYNEKLEAQIKEYSKEKRNLKITL